MWPKFTAVVLTVGFAVAVPDQPPKPKLWGIITQVQGPVEVDGPGLRGVPLASPWQVIQVGATVRVPKLGSVGIVCSNRRFVRLSGPTSWSLLEPNCTSGKELTPAEYSLISPQGGRFRVVEGLLVLEREMRSGEGDDPLAPIVSRPRNTLLRTLRPTVSWSRIPAATYYEVQWIGRGAAGLNIRLGAGTVECSEKLESLSVCSLPWPEKFPSLAPGEIFFLKVAARNEISGPWHSHDPVEVRTQSMAETVTLERQLHDLESLGLEGAVLDATRAGLLAQNGILGDAMELYSRALASAPTPELRVTLADLESAIGLVGLAETLYREGLSDGALSIRAASAFGLGRIAYARGSYQDATASFQQAQELYSKLLLSEEENAARAAAEKAASRVPK